MVDDRGCDQMIPQRAKNCSEIAFESRLTSEGCVTRLMSFSAQVKMVGEAVKVKGAVAGGGNNPSQNRLVIRRAPNIQLLLAHANPWSGGDNVVTLRTEGLFCMFDVADPDE